MYVVIPLTELILDVEKLVNSILEIFFEMGPS
jgi:hypothetical protein